MQHFTELYVCIYLLWCHKELTKEEMIMKILVETVTEHRMP